MCLSSRKEVQIDKVDAFKVFTRDNQGLLQSVFAPTFKSGLKYPSNERIRVDTDEANFFAFAEFKNAISIARQGRRRWNMVKGGIIVLPVTMYEIVAEGKYHVPSDDPQTMDGYYPAFEAKEIQLHDNQETRNAFYDEVLRQYLDLSQYSMSAIEKEAFRHRLPHIEILSVSEKRRRAG
jgi:hypothetical protein